MFIFLGQILKLDFFACVLQSLPFQDIQNGSISNIYSSQDVPNGSISNFYSSQDVQNGSISNMLIIMTPQNDWQHIFIIILTIYSDCRHICVVFHYDFNPNSLRSKYIQIQSWSWVLETVINTLEMHLGFLRHCAPKPRKIKEHLRKWSTSMLWTHVGADKHRKSVLGSPLDAWKALAYQ